MKKFYCPECGKTDCLFKWAYPLVVIVFSVFSVMLGLWIAGYGSKANEAIASQTVPVEVSGETRTEVKALRVQLLCEVKGCDGIMGFGDGGVLTSYPAQYPHKCTKCGNQIYVSGQVYPYIEYQEVATQ